MLVNCVAYQDGKKLAEITGADGLARELRKHEQVLTRGIAELEAKTINEKR